MNVHAQELHETVLFEYDKSYIPDSSMLHLVKLIHKNAIDRVLIEAHCDSIGSREYNRGLSLRRANEVKRLLTDNGVPSEQIKTCIGYGKERPIVGNETAENRQRNRRAHITFYLHEFPQSITKKNVPAFDYYDTLSVMKIVPETAPLQQTKLTSESKETIGGISISELKVGQNVILDNMYFWGGRHVLKKESYPTLKELHRLLVNYPTLEIEIEGHVCCTVDQPDGYDWDTDRNDLSVARAKAIYEFLVLNGIAKSRLSYKGYGGSRKINLDESNEALRSVNRRVEFKIIKL